MKIKDLLPYLHGEHFMLISKFYGYEVRALWDAEKQTWTTDDLISRLTNELKEKEVKSITTCGLYRTHDSDIVVALLID